MTKGTSMKSLLAAALALAVSSTAAQVAWDAAADFDPANNPSGQWSYGWQDGDGPFNLFAVPRAPQYCGLPVTCWVRDTNFVPLPVIGSNLTGAPIDFNWKGERAIVPVNSLHVVPGLSGERPVVRWTAPAAGRYVIFGSAQLVHNMAESVVLNVRAADALAHSKRIAGFGSVRHFKIERWFAAGETVDVSIDPDGGVSYDYVELRISVTIGL